MYQLKRVTAEPKSPMRILVDQSEGTDGGFAGGGSFFFSPAGEDGDRHQLSGHAARAIMSDPGLAQHFECTPPLPGAPDVVSEQPAGVQDSEADEAPAAAQEPKRAGRRPKTREASAE